MRWDCVAAPFHGIKSCAACTACKWPILAPSPPPKLTSSDLDNRFSFSLSPLLNRVRPKFYRSIITVERSSRVKWAPFDGLLSKSRRKFTFRPIIRRSSRKSILRDKFLIRKIHPMDGWREVKKKFVDEFVIVSHFCSSYSHRFIIFARKKEIDAASTNEETREERRIE